MLFARLRSDDRAFWFLGPASFVKHEGEWDGPTGRSLLSLSKRSNQQPNHCA
jgi:hypothetical protein